MGSDEHKTPKACVVCRHFWIEDECNSDGLVEQHVKCGSGHLRENLLFDSIPRDGMADTARVCPDYDAVTLPEGEQALDG